MLLTRTDRHGMTEYMALTFPPRSRTRLKLYSPPPAPMGTRGRRSRLRASVCPFLYLYEQLVQAQYLIMNPLEVATSPSEQSPSGAPARVSLSSDCHTVFVRASLHCAAVAELSAQILLARVSLGGGVEPDAHDHAYAATLTPLSAIVTPRVRTRRSRPARQNAAEGRRTVLQCTATLGTSTIGVARRPGMASRSLNFVPLVRINFTFWLHVYFFFQ